MNYLTHTFGNGLRLIQRPSAGRIVYLGYAIAAGTASEADDEEGLAHFCEHMTFKGTARRSASRIIAAIEGLGGELNAYTTKESTVYYCAICREHARLAIDVLTDMVFHSTYPDDEVEREREVVCDEIETYLDTPSELIYDDFESLLFHGLPLGHNILGTKEAVRRFTAADARRFTARHYRPENAIFFIDGTMEREASASRIVAKAMERGEDGAMEREASASRAIEKAMERVADAPRSGFYHQSHVMIGRRCCGDSDPRRLALYVLNNILGGPAMSSRLNMSLRERHGLVYTVESTLTTYVGDGVWSVYFGCDHADAERCRRLVMRELARLRDKPLSPRALDQAKRQLRGQIALASDSRESFALDFARAFLHHGWLKDPEALCRDIDALTPGDLHAAAQDIFDPARLTTLTL